MNLMACCPAVPAHQPLANALSARKSKNAAQDKDKAARPDGRETTRDAHAVKGLPVECSSDKLPEQVGTGALLVLLLVFLAHTL